MSNASTEFTETSSAESRKDGHIFKKIISEFNVAKKIDNMLDLGCGDGTETLGLAQVFTDSKILGIDFSLKTETVHSDKVITRFGDATKLQMPANFFDTVYSYHVLEHVDGYEKAVEEVHRVLKKGGIFYVGTPNKQRLASYVILSNTSVGQRILWNLNEWRLRLIGRFENRYGAHAGFTKNELKKELSAHFSKVIDVTDLYYRNKYNGKFDLFKKLHIGNYIFPAVYFLCIK